MPSTMWTVIARARQGGQDALDALLRKYRSPILAFVRNAGFGPDEAEDLTQEVFLTVIGDDVLAKADQSRGKFRSLLLAITRHTISSRRRRDGDRRPVRLDPGEPEDRPRLEDLLAAPDTDDTFDPLWIENLVRIGMNRLREECDKDGTPYLRALLMHTSDELGYPEIAARLGVSETDVKNYLHRARVMLKRHVLKEVQEYSSSRSEYESEVSYLMRFLQ